MLRNMCIIYTQEQQQQPVDGCIFMRPLPDFVLMCWMLEDQHQLQMSSELLSILFLEAGSFISTRTHRQCQTASHGTSGILPSRFSQPCDYERSH